MVAGPECHQSLGSEMSPRLRCCGAVGAHPARGNTETGDAAVVGEGLNRPAELSLGDVPGSLVCAAPAADEDEDAHEQKLGVHAASPGLGRLMVLNCFYNKNRPLSNHSSPLSYYSLIRENKRIVI